jgi:flagellar biosynthesis/type III secretory pathway protein FliH
MITAMERRQADIDAQIIYGENQGHERGLAQGLVEGLAKGRAEGLAEGRTEGRADGLAEAKARLAGILRLHPGADPDTILKLMAEANNPKS